MRLKLDLHPIYNDSRAIEESLARVMDEAVEKRASEIEIIPGKGSGALKKTVLRFLDRSDVKARYHRLEKDSDNWGRLFVHFRHPAERKPERKAEAPRPEYRCFCCGESIPAALDSDFTGAALLECPVCGSPNKVSARLLKNGTLALSAVSGYEAG